MAEIFAKQYPDMQVACFDTFRRVAQIIPLPRRFDAKGVRRYGFHGLSCASVMEDLKKNNARKADGNVIIAHLGNGASITAVKAGKSIDTSMGFTPAGGMPMGSRTGDIDPGALLYIMKSEGLSLDATNRLINHESGLVGVSEKSSNMYDLLESEAGDVRAREAVDLFCYEAKKRIGAYVAALGGADILVFTGGMGENAPRIRRRICAGLEFLGIVLNDERNENGEAIISTVGTPVEVRVIHTNEEALIARITHGFIGK
jgi:acetate kinase